MATKEEFPAEHDPEEIALLFQEMLEKQDYELLPLSSNAFELLDETSPTDVEAFLRELLYGTVTFYAPHREDAAACVDVFFNELFAYYIERADYSASDPGESNSLELLILLAQSKNYLANEKAILATLFKLPIN